MSDYIERDELFDNIRNDVAPFNVAMVFRHIHNMPTADVAPVRHGQWTPADQIGDCCYTCSECGFERDAYLLDVGNYCPACGARMSRTTARRRTTLAG